MIYAIVVVLVLIADQAVKFWTTKNILLDAVGEACKPLIEGFVHMTNVHNYGAAFGILQDARWPLAIVSALFVLVIIILISREVIHTPFGRWTAVLVSAGALGNCIDRVLYGYVVDMFEFEFSLFGKPFHFPVFNVADIFITVCGILFCIHLLFHNEPEAVKEANQPEFIRRRRQEKRQQAAAQEKAARRRAPEAEGKTAAEPAPAPEGSPTEEWSFGAVIPEPASDRQEPVYPEPVSLPDYLSELPAVRQRSGNAPAAKPAPAPAPKPAPEPEETDTLALGDDELPEFTLEDILSEFGDY